MSKDLLYQVALTLVPNIGSVYAKILVEHFGNAEDIFKAGFKKLNAVDNIPESCAKAIKSFDNFSEAEEEIEFIEKYKIQPLFITDKNYPQRFLNCYDPPTILFQKGEFDLNASRIVGIPQ